jgi:hypothetical protein
MVMAVAEYKHCRKKNCLQGNTIRFNFSSLQLVISRHRTQERSFTGKLSTVTKILSNEIFVANHLILKVLIIYESLEI